MTPFPMQLFAFLLFWSSVSLASKIDGKGKQIQVHIRNINSDFCVKVYNDILCFYLLEDRLN